MKFLDNFWEPFYHLTLKYTCTSDERTLFECPLKQMDHILKLILFDS